MGFRACALKEDTVNRRKCQPGDIAICINTDLPENAGLLVEVLAVDIFDPAWGDDHGPLCRVRVAGNRPLHFNYRVGDRWRRSIAREGTAPESRLLPITPPAPEREELRRSELEAR